MNKIPASNPAHENITLLTICPNADDHKSLETILEPESWTIQGARSLGEATTMLRAHPSLIVCEKDLPDGTWKDVFSQARDMDNPPPVVVVSRHADERLWAEVLNLGGYDVLLKPFDRSEVSRVISMALRHGHHTGSFPA
jgi:DNA-binding response OmpR family regulator